MPEASDSSEDGRGSDDAAKTQKRGGVEGLCNNGITKMDCYYTHRAEEKLPTAPQEEEGGKKRLRDDLKEGCACLLAARFFASAVDEWSSALSLPRA